MNKKIIRLEGLLVFLACIYAFVLNDYNLIWFFVLLLFPDLSMIGYIKGNKAGAVTYNLFHTYLLSGSILVIGIIIKSDILIQLGIIWTAHIGIDRLMGYGLKYPTDFKDTHLDRL